MPPAPVDAPQADRFPVRHELISRHLQRWYFSRETLRVEGEEKSSREPFHARINAAARRELPASLLNQLIDLAVGQKGRREILRRLLAPHFQDAKKQAFAAAPESIEDENPEKFAIEKWTMMNRSGSPERPKLIKIVTREHGEEEREGRD